MRQYVEVVLTRRMECRYCTQSQAPQPSSSSSSLGFVLIFFAGAAGLGFTSLPRLDVREIGVEVLLNPFGKDFLVLDWAASHPAKSGSPPSSYGMGDGLGLVEIPDDGRDGIGALNGSSSRGSLPLSSSSSMAPQASKTSSCSCSSWSVVTSTGCSDIDRRPSGWAAGRKVCLGEFSFAEGDDIVGRGTDAERGPSASAGFAPLAVGWISPSAVASLFVNEEMAHPAQDLSLESPMRAGSLVDSALVVGGSAVSGMVRLKFRMRWRYWSSVLLA